MKKLLLATILATTLMSTSFASDKNKVNWRISENFKKEFRDVEEVEWTVKKDFVRAAFVEDGITKEAYYDHSGELISTSTQIGIDDLPAATKRAFAKKYEGYTVKEAVKMTTDTELAYYISVENSEHSLILKAVNNSFSVYKKTNK